MAGPLMTLFGKVLPIFVTFVPSRLSRIGVSLPCSRLRLLVARRLLAKTGMLPVYLENR